jgi:hypothetical protein
MKMIRKGMHSFNSELETCLSTDYSKEGMGWILQQKTCKCKKISPTCCPDGWRLVLAGGAFCEPAERKYSPIEGEATAIFKGLQDTRYYTLGCKKLHIATDHQPLVTTLGKQLVADVPNKRLARIKEKTMCWRSTVPTGWFPGFPAKPGLTIPDDSGGLLLLARPQLPRHRRQIHRI